MTRVHLGCWIKVTTVLWFGAGARIYHYIWAGFLSLCCELFPLSFFWSPIMQIPRLINVKQTRDIKHQFLCQSFLKREGIEHCIITIQPSHERSDHNVSLRNNTLRLPFVQQLQPFLQSDFGYSDSLSHTHTTNTSVWGGKRLVFCKERFAICLFLLFSVCTFTLSCWLSLLTMWDSTHWWIMGIYLPLTHLYS